MLRFKKGCNDHILQYVLIPPQLCKWLL